MVHLINKEKYELKNLLLADTLESIKENELDDVDINAHEWQKIRDGENTNWDGELDIISEYKHQVNECLQLLNDGTIEQMLMAEDKKI